MGFNLFLQGSDKVTPDFTDCAKSSDPSSSPAQEPQRLRWSGRRAGWSLMLKFTTLETPPGFSQCPKMALTAAAGFSHGSGDFSILCSQLLCENSSFAIKSYPPVSLLPQFLLPLYIFSKWGHPGLFSPHLSLLLFSSDCSFRSQVRFILWISGIQAELEGEPLFLAAWRFVGGKSGDTSRILPGCNRLKYNIQ